MLYAFQVGIAVVLLFNISINTACKVLPNAAWTMEEALFHLTSPASINIPTVGYKNSMAILSFGVSIGKPMGKKPHITITGIYDPVACPPGSTSCVQFYLSRAEPFGSDLPELPFPPLNTSRSTLTTPNYYTMFQTPIYHVYMSLINGSHYRDQVTLDDCRIYGYETHVLLMCAKDVYTEENTTSVVIGESDCNPILISRGTFLRSSYRF